jgi:TRAP-type C4-dicarboxylate transport system permease small subunit
VASFERIFNLITKFFDKISQAGVFAMLVLVIGNILGRKVGKPIYGAFDYACFLSAILVAFAIPYCGMKRGHIRVEMFVAQLPGRVQGIIDSITNILGFGIFSLITWQCVVLANDMRRAGELSMTSLTPFYPYIYAIAFGCGLLCIVILIDLIKSLIKVVKG